MRTWRTLQAICASHALRFVFDLHGTQKFHPIVKYEHYQILSGTRASLNSNTYWKDQPVKDDPSWWVLYTTVQEHFMKRLMQTI